MVEIASRPSLGLSADQCLKIHAEVLTANAAKALEKLAAFSAAENFYLAGGTAVALHLGHRISVDLDWMTSKPFDSAALNRKLEKQPFPHETQRIGRGTLHGLTCEVRTSFLEFEYPLLQPLQCSEPFNCPIASIPDLAAMKLNAILQRGARKDFVDIYAIGASGYSLPEMLDAFTRKFSMPDVTDVLLALSYTDDAEKEGMPQLLKPVAWKAMIKTIRSWIAQVRSKRH